MSCFNKLKGTQIVQHLVFSIKEYFIFIALEKLVVFSFQKLKTMLAFHEAIMIISIVVLNRLVVNRATARPGLLQLVFSVLVKFKVCST